MAALFMISKTRMFVLANATDFSGCKVKNPSAQTDKRNPSSRAFCYGCWVHIASGSAFGHGPKLVGTMGLWFELPPPTRTTLNWSKPYTPRLEQEMNSTETLISFKMFDSPLWENMIHPKSGFLIASQNNLNQNLWTEHLPHLYKVACRWALPIVIFMEWHGARPEINGARNKWLEILGWNITLYS